MIIRVLLTITLIGAVASSASAGGSPAIRGPISSAATATPSSGNLDMIQLQSVMTQRQTALQMSANLSKAMAAGSRTVAGNIGK